MAHIYSTPVQRSTFMPTRIVEIELAEPTLPVISAFDEYDELRYQRALCLIRLHSQPLGTVEFLLAQEQTLPEHYLPLIWQTLQDAILAHLLQDGLPAVQLLAPGTLSYSETPRCILAREEFLATAPLVSIIIPTHERAHRLDSCLRSLLALQYANYEIIVVDNAPQTNETLLLIQQSYVHIPNLHYLCEERKGPSWARNRGAQIARGSLLAFVDDDVVVDRYWLVELARAFALNEQVACVCSLIMPLKLSTPAQIWFEEYGGFSKGFTRRVFDLAAHHPHTPLYPYNAGSFGAGASAAFTAQFFRQLGGFDPRLGGNGPARTGEDIELFFQVIQQGYQLVYEPRSLLYHLHRADYAGLRKQLYHYGVGMTAFLTKNIIDQPHILLDFLSKVPAGLALLLHQRSSKNKKKSTGYPQELTTSELRGMLYGPLAYLQTLYLMRHQCRTPFSDQTPSAEGASQRLKEPLGIHNTRHGRKIKA